MAELSPMMKHYMTMKEEVKDCILFYRLGDFYEMFFEDAKVVSKELELTLTGKNCGLEERAPMCGVPYHALDTYLNRLVKMGYKVAICEQVEDPKEAKGIVKREIVRIVTPGTNLNTQAMEEKKNNYLMSIVYVADKYGISIADVTTGEYLVTEVDSRRKLLDEIARFIPTEIICNEAFLMSGIDIDDFKNRQGIAIYPLEPWYYDDERCVDCLKEHFKTSSLSGLGLDDYDTGVIAAGGLLQYLYETQKTSLTHFTHLHPYSASLYMIIDSSTRRNLELTETLREKQKRGSLLWVLDRTKTAMGGRLLRNYVEQPLIHTEDINKRLSLIEELNQNMIAREEMREYLNPVYDLERLLSKISYKSATPRDLTAFKGSLSMLPHIKNILSNDFQTPLAKEIREELDPLEDLYSLIDRAIAEEAPLSQKDGGIIKEGYHETVDSLRRAKTDGKNWLAELEQNDRERTGIKNLKIKFNKVFGYYFEVTNSYKDLVPDDYVRKQTLVNGERYTTPRLKELEDTILNAEDKLFSLEYNLFSEIRDTIAQEVERIQTTAKAIAKLDVFASLSCVAEQNHYVRPKINETGLLNIKNGRHPVVEKMLNNDSFIANDTYLDNDEKRISIITGPNMAGKSTYMRQTALIVLMACIGSFVPAEQADICIVDRIFTRVGASDDLASGQSTFMVEMTEVANILRNATSKSLLILDEIGRGTSTYDGLSIAWAVVEYISNKKLIGAKTLFATHYHELTELEGKLSGVNNYCIAVKEKGDDIVFLRKIVKGGADKSYGVAVAKLAGIPEAVIVRANELVGELLENDITFRIRDLAEELGSKKSRAQKPYVNMLEMNQMSLFDTVKDDDIIEELRTVDISHMTPVDALVTLQRLQNKLNNRW